MTTTFALNTVAAIDERFGPFVDLSSATPVSDFIVDDFDRVALACLVEDLGVFDVSAEEVSRFETVGEIAAFVERETGR